MDKHTWGDSQAAINLATHILAQPEYNQYSKFVSRNLSKQFIALSSIMAIPDKNTRETTLKMWHDRFKGLVSVLPEVVRTHTLCVETGEYRKKLRQSKEE